MDTVHPTSKPKEKNAIPFRFSLPYLIPSLVAISTALVAVWVVWIIVIVGPKQLTGASVLFIIGLAGICLMGALGNAVTIYRAEQITIQHHQIIMVRLGAIDAMLEGDELSPPDHIPNKLDSEEKNLADIANVINELIDHSLQTIEVLKLINEIITHKA